MINRVIQTRIETWLFKQKTIILYGARQVGKTTLAKKIIQKYPEKHPQYFNCEDIVVQQSLVNKSAIQIKNFFGNSQLVVLDEAQTITNIGSILKVFTDAYPDVQIIATGSSSFDLSNKINEPLTGRSLEFKIYPISIQELSQSQSQLEIRSNLEKYILFGTYPEVVQQDNSAARELINDLTQKYLFKDILNFEGIKNSNLVYKILQALALQLGQEVSYTEIANLVGSNKNTVERYIDILEKSFIIFRLPALSKNVRNEISKMKKIYFYDTGVRNSLLQNFANLDLRTDKGALWENFVILEILKKYENNTLFGNFYFWRNYNQQEIDLIIENDNLYEVFEIKFNVKKQPKIPTQFQENYPNNIWRAINSENFWDIL